MFKIISHDVFDKDINVIYSFCDMNYGTRYALKIKKSIKQAVSTLSLFPYSNPKCFKYQDVEFRAKLVLNIYHIVYCVLDNLIIVYRVYDGRRNISPSDLFQN